MKKEKQAFSKISKAAIISLVVLTLVAIWTNIYIAMSTTLRQAGFPGTLSMLFDYSKYSGGGHGARFAGQLLSNLVAYLFMIAAIVLFVLSLKLIRHDKSVKIKCAILSLAVFIPATFGLTGGLINFIGEGIGTLIKMGTSSIAALLALVLLTYALDILYLVLAIICLVKGIKTAVRVNRGEVIEDEEEEIPGRETPAERAAREEKEAAQRVALLDDIRQIVKEELEKLDKVVIAKSVPVVYVETKNPTLVPKKEEPKPAPAPAPAPVVVEEEEEDEEKRKSAPRIPFAKKMVKADKEIQDKYNEIKNEILAYGAKSRVSIACDTFRLHRKAYVKINLVGKTLKVYFALRPKDFVDSPIPVMDASDKVAYEEVPALLKVKSNLSVKRAKELVKLAMEADNISKENVPEEHNWIRDLRAELRK